MTDTDRDDVEIHAGLEPASEHVVVGAQPTLEQSTISVEIAERHRAEREVASAAGGALPAHPPRDFAPYRSTTLRHPTHELVRADPEEIELVSPALGQTDVEAE